MSTMEHRPPPMPNDLDPLHRHLEFNAPLSGRRADRLVAFLASRAQGTVVDLGCGWASLLTRLLTASDRVDGVGIDRDPGGFEHAREVAAGQGVAGRLKLVAGDAKSRGPDGPVGGAICIGASQIWGPPVESKLPLDYTAALAALRRLVEPGAPVVYGEGIWSAAPGAAATAPLAGRPDEFLFLPDLIDLAWEHGFSVVQTHEATLNEWDDFESAYAARYSCWLAGHDRTHPDAAAVQARAKLQREGYYRGYRGILGMAYLALLAY